MDIRGRSLLSIGDTLRITVFVTDRKPRRDANNRTIKGSVTFWAAIGSPDLCNFTIAKSAPFKIHDRLAHSFEYNYD
jgi:hypothetical protein